MKLSEAVKQVGPEENIEAAFTRLYGEQVQPEHFRRTFVAVRNVPDDVIRWIKENSTLTPEEAFRARYPDHVNIGQFLDAVMQSRKTAVPAPEPESAPAPAPEPESTPEG